MKLGLIQTSMSEDIDHNLQKTRTLVQQAARKGAEMICLPELFAMPYFAQAEDKKFFGLAEKIPGKVTHFLSQIAKENKVCLIGGSLFEKAEDGKFYNTALIFDPAGNIVAKYRKVHVPHDQYYSEQFYFTPGNLGFVQATVNGIKIAPLICYDQWFPEPARINVLQGTQIIFYPTAIGWFDQMKKDEPFSAQRWEDAMRSHASLNGVYVVAVNRVGTEHKLSFWGGSFVADPFGQVVARASEAKEETLIVDIDISKVKQSQEGWSFLKNRRADSYGLVGGRR